MPELRSGTVPWTVDTRAIMRITFSAKAGPPCCWLISSYSRRMEVLTAIASLPEEMASNKGVNAEFLAKALSMTLVSTQTSIIRV